MAVCSITTLHSIPNESSSSHNFCMYIQHYAQHITAHRTYFSCTSWVSMKHLIRKLLALRCAFQTHRVRGYPITFTSNCGKSPYCGYATICVLSTGKSLLVQHTHTSVLMVVMVYCSTSSLHIHEKCIKTQWKIQCVLTKRKHKYRIRSGIVNYAHYTRLGYGTKLN